MVVVSRAKNGSYRLVEVDSTISKLKFAVFPSGSVPRSFKRLSVTEFVNRQDQVAGVLVRSNWRIDTCSPRSRPRPWTNLCFPETYALVAEVEQRYGIKVNVFKPEGCDTVADFERKWGEHSLGIC